MGRREVSVPEVGVWLGPGTGLKEGNSLTLKLETWDPSSRKPPSSVLACLWALITSPSLSLSQRVQWPMSPTPSHHGYQASSPPPRAPSQATLPLRISTVWLPVQTWPEQSRVGLLGVLVPQLSLTHRRPPHAAAPGQLMLRIFKKFN